MYTIDYQLMLREWHLIFYAYKEGPVALVSKGKLFKRMFFTYHYVIT